VQGERPGRQMPCKANVFHAQLASGFTEVL